MNLVKTMYFIFAFCFLTNISIAQKYAIVADKLIDVRAGKVIDNPIIVTLNNKIIDVNNKNQIPQDAIVVRLDGYTVMPGMINSHTHILSDGKNYELDLYRHSSTYRALRAQKYLSLLLTNGFTSIRDLGSEGALNADIDLAKAIDSGFIMGPRMFSAGKGIAATGSYVPSPKIQNPELSLRAGAQYVSGNDECVKAVREQCNSGQKWIKIFSDWKDHSTFNYDEIKTITGDAKKFGIPVAAHAKTKDAIKLCINAGVRSIEHGDAFDEELISLAFKSKVFWCPTILDEEHNIVSPEIKYQFLNKAYKSGLKIVCGSDSGSLSWSVNPAKEIEYFVTKAYFTPIDAIKACTINAAELLQKETEIGVIAIGYFADIIGVKGNPLNDVKLLQSVDFVMKDGKIIKQSN
jgi:imidazolonepropionase-like amidohydrolase